MERKNKMTRKKYILKLEKDLERTAKKLREAKEKYFALPDCETCKKCGTNNCGNDTTNLQCYEPN
jgi:hypothetical protein